MSPVHSWDLMAELWLGLQPFLLMMALAVILALIIADQNERFGSIFGVAIGYGAIGITLGIFAGLSEIGSVTTALATAAVAVVAFLAVALRKPKKDDPTPALGLLMSRTATEKAADGRGMQAREINGIEVKELSPRKVMVGVFMLMLALLSGMLWGNGIAQIRAHEAAEVLHNRSESALDAVAAREADKMRLAAELKSATAATE